MPDLLPDDEPERLAAVRRYDVLDTPPDGAFDRVTALAARLCDVPIATITIVDEDRIWFKSAVGLPDGVTEIGRDPGLCASAIIGDVPYVVADASLDPRTLSNPLVCGELGLRFYVAVPLRTADGYNLGTLNIIDQAPREVSDDQLATLRDLAAIVVDELELRLAAKRAVELESLRAAAQFRDAIVAGVSHEMRTPIGVLSGIAELPPEALAEDAGAVQQLLGRQVRLLDRLVEQFLDFSDLEHGHDPSLERERTDLCALVAEAVDLYADRGTIEVVVDGPVPHVAIDRARTLRIVSELLTNALRFGPPGCPIRVEVEASDAEVRVTVADAGGAIPQEALPHLFQRYYRSPESTGSGLGLHVAEALARAQDGAIEVTSRPEVGTRFTLVLPTVDAEGGR